MKHITPPALTLILASTFVAWAQDAPPPPPLPVPPPTTAGPTTLTLETVQTDATGGEAGATGSIAVETITEAGATKKEDIATHKTILPGGKLLLSTKSGDKNEVRVIDLETKESADAPLRINFDADNAEAPPSGPVTFVGVAVSAVPADLSKHLPLAKGVGLVVQSVSKDSPAAKAGIVEDDILTRLDDQILIHPAQFSVLIAGKKEGDNVNVTLLRKGAQQEIVVTLGKRDGGDPPGSSATLKFGDVEVQVSGPGDEAKPLRTFIKHWNLNRNSPEAKDLQLNDTFKISGDDFKIEGGKFKVLEDVLKSRSDKLEALVHEQSKKAAGEVSKAQQQAAEVSKDATSAARDAADIAKAAAHEENEKAKAEAAAERIKTIQELSRLLEKLQNE
ncbi:MAG: htrA [Verrucomicrobiales bacterium]|nr:htrA [Verrucomicrobiales bacterium]